MDALRTGNQGQRRLIEINAVNTALSAVEVKANEGRALFDFR
jgi:hypothetical protein